MTDQTPAHSEAAHQQQQGDSSAMPQQTGTPLAPQQEQQTQQTPMFRDFASI